MATATETLTNPAKDLAELQRTIQNLMQGQPGTDEMDRAAQEMDSAREEIRQRHGQLDLAAELSERDE